MKQRFVFDSADGKISLWAVESESGSLAARDNEGSNLALFYQLPAPFEGFGILTLLWVCRIGAVGRSRNQISAYRSRGRLFDAISRPIVNFCKVQLLDLCKQILPLSRIQLVPKC